jgi:hypothetical protein
VDQATERGMVYGTSKGPLSYYAALRLIWHDIDEETLVSWASSYGRGRFAKALIDLGLATEAILAIMLGYQERLDMVKVMCTAKRRPRYYRPPSELPLYWVSSYLSSSVG